MPDILIIDDDLAVAGSMQRALQGEFHVQVLDGGEKATALLAQGSRYAAILCDLFMPDLNGVQLYERILAIDRSQAERIIFVSGGIYTQEIQSQISLLKNPLLQKPFTLDQIRQVVRDVSRPLSR
jgi:two-component system NtrC family sensor kinase